jgi:exopolysaccharide production protein ExoY
VLSTPPGMTGLWQVTGRSEGVSYAERVQMDQRYVRSMTFLFDVRILIRTAKVVLRGMGS